MKSFESRLVQGCLEMGIELTREQVGLMTGHARELITWNRKINLTAIRDVEQIAEKHFVDAVAACRFIPDKGRFMDLGSGGGFPALPLKVVHPLISVCLVDAVRKKVNFLSHVIRTLQLKDIRACHDRIEALANDPDHAGTYDGVVARGFSALDQLAALSIPMLRPGGTLYALKGENGPREITPDLEQRFDIHTHYYCLPFDKSDRYLICLKQR